MRTFTKCIVGITTLTVGFLSCSKDNNNPGEPVCRVTSIVLADTMENRIKYNQEGQLTHIGFLESGQDRVWDLFEYSTGKITQTDSLPGGSGSYSAIYTLGTNGFADIRVSGANNSYKDSTYYTYDGNGYLVKSVQRYYLYNVNIPGYQLSYERVHNYTIVNGNVITDKSYTIQNGEMMTYPIADITYEYYSDKLAKVDMRLSLSSENNYPFLGKGSGYLVKKAIFSFQSGGTDTAEYTYQLDTDGKPLRVDYLYTNQSGVWPEHVTFSYECK